MTVEIDFERFIAAVQDQLVRAQRNREYQGIAPLFMVDSLEIEASVALVENRSVSGGFDIKVIALGGEASKQHQSTHTIRLKLVRAGVPTDAQAPRGAFPRLTREDT
jgi:hypothetical protein